MYSKLPLLILDDVFSGLDSKSIGQISSSLFANGGHFHKAGRSVVLATHSRKYRYMKPTHSNETPC